MTIWTRLFGHRKPKKTETWVTPPYLIEDAAERVYRVRRISEISEAFGMDPSDLAEDLDTWAIREVTSYEGENQKEVTHWIATPIWDDEWFLSRHFWDSEEEALAEVARVGGTLVE